MSGKELEFRVLIAVAIFRSKFKLNFIHSNLHQEGFTYLVVSYLLLCFNLFGFFFL